MNPDCGYVLAVVPYREHDAMITFLSENHGLMRLILPGYYKPKSKQGKLGLEYSYVKYESKFNDNQLNRITGGELLDGYLTRRSDFDWLLYSSCLSEITIRCYDEENHDLFYAMFAKGLRDTSQVITLIELVKNIIEIQGITPDVTGCVICGSSLISQFSVEQGGYLCQQHVRNHRHNQKELLIALKGLFTRESIRDYLEEIDAKQVLSVLIDYLEYHGDYKFNSWKLISNV